MERICPESAKKPPPALPSAAHNPKVVGSNPAPATTNPPISLGIGGFSLIFQTFLCCWIFSIFVRPRFRPIRRNVQKGLDGIGEDIRHGIRRLTLGLGGHVGVGVQGKPGAVMAQHSAHRFDVHAILQGYRCERMPLWHNKDKSENPCGATG